MLALFPPSVFYLNNSRKLLSASIPPLRRPSLNSVITENSIQRHPSPSTKKTPLFATARPHKPTYLVSTILTKSALSRHGTSSAGARIHTSWHWYPPQHCRGPPSGVSHGSPTSATHCGAGAGGVRGLAMAMVRREGRKHESFMVGYKVTNGRFGKVRKSIPFGEGCSFPPSGEGHSYLYALACSFPWGAQQRARGGRVGKYSNSGCTGVYNGFACPT